MDLINKFKKLFLSKEFRNFIIGGGSAFIIDFSILFSLVYILQIKAELFDFIFIPNIISTSISIVYSFFFQKHISFKSSSEKAKTQFGKFILVQAFNLSVFNGILFGLLLNTHLSVAFSKILSTSVQMGFSFMMYKFFVFKKIN